jgi:hypothetical protein
MESLRCHRRERCVKEFGWPGDPLMKPAVIGGDHKGRPYIRLVGATLVVARWWAAYRSISSETAVVSRRLLEFFRRHFDSGRSPITSTAPTIHQKKSCEQRGRAFKYVLLAVQVDRAAAIEERPPCLSGFPLRELRTF